MSVVGSTIKIDKDLPDAVINEMMINKTKVGFYTRSLVNPGLENPGYEHAEIEKNMLNYEI